MAADQHVATANGNGTAHGAQEGAKGAKLPTGHEALDLAETAEGAAKQAAERLEAKRVEHERTRQATRAKFEEQMRQLEAEQLAEERQLLSASNSPVNGAEAASAPTTPPGASRPVISPAGNITVNGNGNGNGNGIDASGETAPIGPPSGAGAKSMPGSRRASGYGGSFGFEKLSLSVMETGGKSKEWEDAGDETAEGTVKYLGMGDDDFVPSSGGKEHKHISAASAALDLAPLSQTRGGSYASRPFDTGLKTSDWPSFPHNRTSTSPLAATTHMLDSGSAGQSEVLAGLGGGSRKTSPTGMADSIASLPAMPSKAVPSAAAGYVAGAANASAAPGAAPAYNGSKLSQPPMPAFSLNDQPRPYAPDPLYGQMFGNGGMGGMGGAFGVGMGGDMGMPSVPAFDPGYDAGFDAYGFDEDPTGYGSGALYSGGAMVRNKRSDADREFNRFSGVRIEDLASEILLLSKDQHGCRYLQKVLEDGDPAHRDLIFREIFGHLPELMVDPFGNYLCQKLLEFSSEEQRNSIVDSVANDLVTISLNMHGTRAVQKMVDFLASPRQAKQIRTLIYALSMNVVALIKDLNGNHVIQKCLNKLIPEDNQFIYNAIAANLIEVATHRHGCCVLQRSIDHASPAQRVQLVTEIIFNSLYLVQDPFGNYVIQYILDLNDARFSEPLIRTFINNVCSLSVQKFSSNVVEKCIRVADPEIRKMLVAEVLNRSRLEKLLRDSYGNYVVQTILDYCELPQRMMLIECIRPILPSIRNTPYGKRIQSKLAREDSSFGHPGYGGRGGGRGGFQGGGGGGYQRHLGRPQLQHLNSLTEVYGQQGGPFGGHGHGMGGQGYMGPQHGGHGGHNGHGVHNGYRGGPHGPHGNHGNHQQHLQHAQHPHAHAHGQGQHQQHQAGPGGPMNGNGNGAGPGAMQPDHTGMSFHAPGPDGQPWLHLRGAVGGPAPNWSVAQQGMEGVPGVPGQPQGGDEWAGQAGYGYDAQSIPLQQ